jgi:hypothetical protein
MAGEGDRAMHEPGKLDRWIRQWGWKLLLVLMAISVLARIWQMWAHGGL